MLTSIDRLLIATTDAEAAAQKWHALLHTEEVARDRVASLGAKRVTLRVGTSDIELLEPDGAGIVADELKRRGRPHLFAAGAAAPDPAKVVQTALATGGVDHHADGGRHYLTITLEGAPIRFVISPEARREPAGDVDYLYEATVLAMDPDAATKRIIALFGLNSDNCVPIDSKPFGYTGILTLFNRSRLDRFEIITPSDPQNTISRYLARTGASFYMPFGESARLHAIEKRAKSLDAGTTATRPDGRGVHQTPDQLWILPQGLDGLMLGLSRPTIAWRWSGHPERVEPVS